MILVSPIQEEQLKAWIGRPVCVVMQDGSEHPGVLSYASGGKIILNESAGPEIAGKPKRKRTASGKARINGKGTQAARSSQALELQPFSPFQPGPSLTSIGPRDELDLSAAVLVFPLLP